MKTIVSHLSPDIDSITSVWLIRKFLPGWENAELKFVPAGSSLDGMDVDSDPDIIHVDTGFGRFDHHQTPDYICASSLVFEFLKKEGHIKDRQKPALERMVKEITGFDHFAEVYFPDPANDHYEFMIHKVIEGGLKSVLRDDLLILQSVFPFLDAIMGIFLKKNQAGEEIKKGFVLTSRWGKTLVMETRNEETTKLALKMGFILVVKKDPDRGNIRIKSLPGKKYDLKPLHEKILKADRVGTWFLHSSGNMLLNSSSKNPNFIASPLTVKRLVEIIRGI